MTIAAVIATASFTSCSNEMDMFDPISSDKATIDLNITNDNVMVTRAEGAVPNPSSWYITVGTNAQIQVSELSKQKYEAGGPYNITVSNYATEAGAIEANDAYYSGQVSKTLVKGSNVVTVACDKAKNCRVKVDLAGLDGFTAISEAKLTVSQEGITDPRVLDNSANGISTGYFYAGQGKTINYSLGYKYNGTTKDALTGSISDPAAATEYQVKVVTNTNGTITLTVTYDTEFETKTAETITIDAATGEKENKN